MAIKIRVLISNRTAALVKPYPYEALIPYWSYSVPGAKFAMRYRPGWDGRIKMLKWDELSSGLFRATKKQIEEELGIKFKVKRYGLKLPSIRGGKPIVSKRYYQNECVDAMEDNGYCGGLILSATGSGKTYMAAMYYSRVEGPHLFVVDQLDLLWQAKKEIESVLGEKVGFVGESKFKPRRVTIGTIQTMHRHRRDARFKLWTKDIQTTLIDEIHVMMNRRNFDVVSDIQPRAVFGLTATLQLTRKYVRTRAWALAGPVIYTFPVQKGMDENVLSRGIVMRVKFKNEVAV